MTFDGIERVLRENDAFRVEMDWIGEGWSGDYNPNDPADAPLLRFYAFEKVLGEWEEIHDGSYCTQFPATTDRALIEKATDLILTRITNAPIDEAIKTILQRLSWIEPSWVMG
jgi:hypothetical protein